MVCHFARTNLFRQFVVCWLCFRRGDSVTSKTRQWTKLSFESKRVIMHWVRSVLFCTWTVYWDCVFMLCIRMQLQLTHFVLRCLRCACLTEIVGYPCVWVFIHLIIYCVVCEALFFCMCCDAEYQHSYEFYCELCAALFPCVRFQLALSIDCVRIASGWKLCVKASGKLIQFCRIKLNWLALLLLCGETHILGSADKILDLRVCSVCLLFLFVVLCVWFCSLLWIKDMLFEKWDNEDSIVSA